MLLTAVRPSILQNMFKTEQKYMAYYKSRGPLLVMQFARLRLHPRMENVRLSLAYMFCNNILSAGKLSLNTPHRLYSGCQFFEWKHCINLVIPRRLLLLENYNKANNPQISIFPL